MTNRNELALDAFLSAGGRLDQLLQRGTPKYFIKSTDVKPADAELGSELYYVDTGDYFVYYDDEWHLKVQGSYSDIKFTLTAEKGDLASAVNPETVSVTYDSEYGTLPTTTPTEGYELEGWYFDAQLTNKVSETDIVKIEGNAKIYAKHVPIVYDIAYDLDGGENGDNPATYTIVTPTITLEPATKVGYDFDGWFSNANKTIAVTNIPLGSHEAITLYAKFTAIEYAITYELDGGVNNPANPATYTVLDAVSFEPATKEGYTFDGWFSDVALLTPATGWVAGSTGDYEVWAKYLENFTVTFNSNGGSAVDAQEIADGSLATEPTPPTLDGSTFEGWYTDDGAFLNAFVFTTPITADITLYAKFTAVTP